MKGSQKHYSGRQFDSGLCLSKDERRSVAEIQAMQTDDCEGGLLKAQDTAVELYQLAALMLGNESDALNLVESTVAQVEVDPCADADNAVDAARHHLIEAAVALMNRADPQAFAAPVSDGSSTVTCIEDDDLMAAGISPAQMAELMGGAGREQLRIWLDQLPPAQRAIFVQRAVLGWDNGTTAASLATGAGEKSGWSAEQVSELFRQALCSLANSLVHSEAQKAAV
jgi:DNA-directed RNA polymerase sigma subunit (sigma70/sigma32)